MEQHSFSHIDAITLSVSDMVASVAFYETLGLDVRYGGPEQPFTTMGCGQSYLNLQLATHEVAHGHDGATEQRWGRAILHVESPAAVDATYRDMEASGHQTEAPPADAAWGERYFHIRDPDGHELSIACRL